MKGRVFIKTVTSKNKNGKKEKKHDLEREFNDIDAILENMDMADMTEMSVDGNDNGGKSNPQVPSTHQIEKDLCGCKLQQIKKECAYDDGTEINRIEVVNNVNQQTVKIKTESTQITEMDVAENIVTDGIVTYGIPSIGMEGGTNIEITHETTDITVTDGVGTECGTKAEITEETKVTVTDGVGTEAGTKTDETTKVTVTDGVGTEAGTNTKITDETAKVAVAEGIGTEAEINTKITDETAKVAVTDGIGKEVKNGIENGVTDSMATIQGAEGENTREEGSDNDTESLTDEINSTDDTEAVTIDEEFSKLCSTCPSNTESGSSSSSMNKECDDENKEMETTETTEEGDGHKKKKRLRMKIKRKSKIEINYKEETDNRSDKTESKETSETLDSEKEEKETKRVDIKYATKNKTTKKKKGRERQDSLVVKTITVKKWKSKKYKCIESGCNELFEDMKE